MTRVLGLKVVLLVSALLAPAVQAQVPQRIHYQGYLTTSAGAPVNGLTTVTVRIYDAPSEGTVVWSGGFTAPVSNGRFSLLLGEPPHAPVTEAVLNGPRYLSVQVAGDAEMSPRQQLVSAPFAVIAHQANALAASATVQGSQITGTISNVTISGATIVDPQLGDPGGICDGSRAGALRWVAATKTFEGCTGTSWVALSQEPLFRISTVYAVGNVGAQSSIAIAPDGLPVISFLDATNARLRMAKCGNVACSADNLIADVDATGPGGQPTAIAIGGDGLPVIAYYDSTNLRLKVAKCGDPACSSGNSIQIVDSSAGYSASIAISADGFPVIAYQDIANNRLKVAKCVNAACLATTSTITTVDPANGTGNYTSIKVGADGLPVISHYGGALMVAKCVNPDCTGTSTLTTVDQAGIVGAYSSIAIGGDGFPVISYFDLANFNLKVAKCANAACTGASTLTAVDTVGDVGYYSSIAIGADGLPVISYFDFTKNVLKLAKCGDAACASGNTLAVADTAKVFGQEGAIAIGADALPVISYRDIVNGDLRVVKCTSAQGACQ